MNILTGIEHFESRMRAQEIKHTTGFEEPQLEESQDLRHTK